MKYSFTKVAKDFKNKYKSLKTSEILIVLLSKATSQESCSLNEKTKFQSNTGLLLITKFVYLLIVNLIFKISVNLEEVIFLQSCYSVAKSCLTLCHPMDCSMPDFTVLHYLPEFAQTHVHWVSDAIQPPHPLSHPSPLAVSVSQHQGLLQWVGSSHQVAKVLEFQLQYQSFQWIFRVDFL